MIKYTALTYADYKQNYETKNHIILFDTEETSFRCNFRCSEKLYKFSSFPFFVKEESNTAKYPHFNPEVRWYWFCSESCRNLWLMSELS